MTVQACSSFSNWMLVMWEACAERHNRMSAVIKCCMFEKRTINTVHLNKEINMLIAAKSRAGKLNFGFP